MASQIETLRAKFDGMNTAQKKQFIVNLRNALENKNNVEHKVFLNECIKKYNSEVQAKTSKAAPKTTSQISASGKEAAGRAASQISSAGKKAASKVAPMASSARTAGKEALNKAAGSSLVDKVAHNETVSKIVDSEVMSKVSKNKNKRVLAIVGALAVVVLVIIVGSISRGGGGVSGSGGERSRVGTSSNGSGNRSSNVVVTEDTAFQYVIDNIRGLTPKFNDKRYNAVSNANSTLAGRSILTGTNAENVYYIGITDTYDDVQTFLVTDTGGIYEAVPTFEVAGKSALRYFKKLYGSASSGNVELTNSSSSEDSEFLPPEIYSFETDDKPSFSGEAWQFFGLTWEEARELCGGRTANQESVDQSRIDNFDNGMRIRLTDNQVDEIELNGSIDITLNGIKIGDTMAESENRLIDMNATADESFYATRWMLNTDGIQYYMILTPDIDDTVLIIKAGVVKANPWDED